MESHSDPLDGAPDLIVRLRQLGMDEYEAAHAPSNMLLAYDRARKEKGKQIGAIGAIGHRIYEQLYGGWDFEIEWRIFREGKIASIESLADAIEYSKGAVGRAMNRLIEHGFVERTRVGRTFRFRPLLRDSALIEWVMFEIDHPAYLPPEYLAILHRILAEFVGGDAGATDAE